MEIQITKKSKTKCYGPYRSVFQEKCTIHHFVKKNYLSLRRTDDDISISFYYYV